jgi:hypothetical protein
MSEDKFRIDAADIACRVIGLAVETALRLRSPAGFRSARAVIESQLGLLAEIGFGEWPSDEDLAEVRRAAAR